MREPCPTCEDLKQLAWAVGLFDLMAIALGTLTAGLVGMRLALTIGLALAGFITLAFGLVAGLNLAGTAIWELARDRWSARRRRGGPRRADPRS